MRQNVSRLAALFAVGIVLTGIYDIILKMKETDCIMTYMFDWPNYITVPLDKVLRDRYPKYSLSVYGEGEYAESLNNLEFSGIPVLFIPGNAGTLMQVRSLATVALRKAEVVSFHFNYFVVGFSKEMSALKGSYLEKQTEFVNECLKVILGLYKDNGHGQSTVVLIGNSIGGIIARGLYTLPDFNPGMVSTIITLATPNTKPVFLVDWHIAMYYSKVNRLWEEQSRRNWSKSALRSLTLLSIGSGATDVQVRSDLTSMQSLGMSNQTISVVSTAVPKVWLSPEHNRILWCKQLLLAMTRALIDMVDIDKMQITDDVNARMMSLRYHFQAAHSRKNSIRDTIFQESTQPVVENLATCKVINKNYFFLSGSKNKHCYKMNISHRSGELTVMYTGSSEDWFGICKSAESCKKYTSLAIKSELIPTVDTQAAVFRMKVSDIRKLGDFVTFSLAGHTQEKLHVKYSYGNATLYSLSAPSLFFSSNILISNGQIFTRISLPFVRYPWIVYKANVTSHCKKPNAVTAVFHVPWFQEHSYRTAAQIQAMQLAFFNEKPLNGNQDAELHLWYNTRCNLSVRVQIDIKATCGQLLLFNLEMIMKWVSALSILLLLQNSILSEDQLENPQRLRLLSAFLLIRLMTELLKSDKTIFAVTFVMIYQVLASIAILVALQFLIWMTSLLVRLLVKIPLSIKRKIFGEETRGVYQSICFSLVAVTIPMIASQFFCGGLGISLCFLITLLKRAVSETKVHHVAQLCFVVLAIRSPGLIAWARDIKYGLKQDPDPFQATSIGFIIVVFFLNNGVQNDTVDWPKLRLLLVCGFAWLMTLDSVALYQVPYFASAAVFINCIFTKQFRCKSVSIRTLAKWTRFSNDGLKKEA